MTDRKPRSAGPVERAHHAGNAGPASAGSDWRRRRRMSARRKQSAVLRLLRGEDLELLSREIGVTMANELLDAKIERLEMHRALARRRSRP